MVFPPFTIIFKWFITSWASTGKSSISSQLLIIYSIILLLFTKYSVQEDVWRICVELYTSGIKASYLVKMLPFIHWLISDMEPSQILVLTQVMAILFKWQPSWPEVKWWISGRWISSLFINFYVKKSVNFFLFTEIIMLY